MPKKTSKAKKAQATKKAIRKDIAKAVERIPQMIADEIEATQPARTETPARSQSSEQTKRTLLWIGVGVITTSVFAMWIVNAKAMFYDIQHTKSAEGQLIAEAKNDFDKILESGPKKPAPITPPAPETNNTEASDAVRQTLQALFAGAATSSSTVQNQNDPTE